MDRLSTSQIASFAAVIDRLPEAEAQRIEDRLVPCAEAARRAGRHWDIAAPARQIMDAMGSQTSGDVQRALVALWALRLPSAIAPQRLPDAVLGLYPFWLDRLAEYLVAATGPYDTDAWVKDVRLVLGLSVPGARSQIIDLFWPMGLGETVRHVRDGHGLEPMLRYVGEAAWRPWLQNHTESRHLVDFTPEGWDQCWTTAADICRSRPDVAGMMGASWFYDPQLEAISPRLAYLRADPVRHGAWLVHQGPSPIHAERASATSPTRRRMIEAGEYVPRGWLLAWPRRALIRWADARTASAMG